MSVIIHNLCKFVLYMYVLGFSHYFSSDFTMVLLYVIYAIFMHYFHEVYMEKYLVPCFQCAKSFLMFTLHMYIIAFHANM